LLRVEGEEEANELTDSGLAGASISGIIDTDPLIDASPKLRM
jgi:hypothetical protein